MRASDGADGGESTTVVATDPAQLAAVMDVETVSGSLTDLGDRAIAVSADEAQDRGWRVGSPVTLTFAGGVTERVTVGAVFDDADLLGGVVVLDGLWSASHPATHRRRGAPHHGGRRLRCQTSAPR